MPITRVLWMGTACLTAAALYDAGCQFFPLAMPAIAALLLLRERVPEMARDTQDARRSAIMLDLVMGAIFIASVHVWTIGPALVVAGFLANHACIIANGLVMPSARSSGANPTYVPITADTRLRLFSDIFISRPGKSGDADFSIGDASIAVGLWVFTAEIVLSRFVS